MDNDLNGESQTVSIRLEGIHKELGAQHVLRGVNLEIFSGETIVLIGASGGGKSVILKHITGLMRPDSGRGVIGNQDISELNEKGLAVIRQRIGVLFQNGALFDSMSIGQNVAFPLRERGEKNIKTFSVGFGTQFDELEYARIVADKFKTQHTEIIIQADIFLVLHFGMQT